VPFDNIISRTDAGALIPEDVASSILGNLPEQSAALNLFRRVNMSRKQQRMPVKSALPTAYFLNGDTGLKQTTEVNWDNVYLTAEEVACVVPIAEAVLDDADYNIWEEIKPDLEEAIGRVIDAAIFFGADKPASWPVAIATAAAAAGNVVARGTATQAEGGIAGDLNDVMAAVEGDGYDVNGFVADRTFRSRLRGARAVTGERLVDFTDGNIEGVTPSYAMRGLWPSGADAAELIAGDFSQGVVAVRQDITYKILTESVIQDSTGAIIYNLAQQDMIALRAVVRVAFAVPNPVNRSNPTVGTRYPFAVLTAP
jgi:HK97 family phage major capsid protein